MHKIVDKCLKNFYNYQMKTSWPV